MPEYSMNGQQSLLAANSAWLVAGAYFELLRVDAQLATRGFPAVHQRVRSFPVRGRCTSPPAHTVICRAVDVACVFYFKDVRCLQRSAATTILLRKAGLSAEMVIGVQLSPFRSHAWVELGRQIVNDKPYTSSMYTVMDRF